MSHYPTSEELSKIAEQHGVGEIYETLVKGFKVYFAEEEVRISPNERTFVRRKRKTGGGFKQEVILRLIPRDSNFEDGLKYRVSIPRFSKFFKIDEINAIGLFPNNWPEKNRKADYAGFFNTLSEVNTFLTQLRQH